MMLDKRYHSLKGKTIETMKIGVFDSGVGGFTVVRELFALVPHVPVVYFGDTARAPYGTKSRQTLIKFALEDVEFLLGHGATIIVIACHSAASTASEVLKQKLDIPVFEVVTPSIEEACSITKTKRIGLIGTRATVASNIYDRKIPKRLPGARLFQQPCPLLVPLVEEGWLRRRETRMIVKTYLRPLKDKQIDTLILGCTHYPLLKKIIQEKAGKRIRIVDPSYEVARQVAGEIARIGTKVDNMDHGEMGQRHRFFLSDLTPHTNKIVASFLGRKVELERADFNHCPDLKMP